MDQDHTQVPRRHARPEARQGVHHQGMPDTAKISSGQLLAGEEGGVEQEHIHAREQRLRVGDLLPSRDVREIERHPLRTLQTVPDRVRELGAVGDRHGHHPHGPQGHRRVRDRGLELDLLQGDELGPRRLLLEQGAHGLGRVDGDGVGVGGLKPEL